MNKKVDSIILRENNTGKEAMERINETGLRVILVVDNNKKLLGIVTDGDIRRAILSRKGDSTLLKDIMIPNPIIAQENSPATEILETMLKEGIQEIPIVDGAGIVVNIALLSELKTIPLSSPDITHKEVEVINHVLTTPFLSIGPEIKKFEQLVANYIGVKYAVAVNSGTSGLHLCIRSLDIKDGDEVITTPFSFIASSNCALFERAKPVFVDIDEKTLNIDVSKIEEKITSRTKAILPVHVFGQPCEMDKIMEIAKKYNLAIIEDACEAIGAEYKGRKAGTFGDAGVFAFYPNKQITTAEGGMIVTNNEKIAKLCQSMRNQGRDENSNSLRHEILGYNYRMIEMSAALGVAQMERIDEILNKRRAVADLYTQKLKKIEGIKVPYIAPDVKMSWFVYVIRLDENIFLSGDRDRIMQKLREKGISCKSYFPPIHLEPFYVSMFGYRKGNFPIAESVANSTIALPFYNNITEMQIDYICEELEATIKTIREKKPRLK